MAKTQFSARLEAKINEALRNRADDLSIGVPVEQYLQNVGYCNGLRDALKYCDDVEKEMDA